MLYGKWEPSCLNLNVLSWIIIGKGDVCLA